MDVDDYKYMWDGSEPGWSLLRSHYQALRLRVFLRPQPSLAAMMHLRRLGLLHLKTSEIRSYIDNYESMLTAPLPRDLIAELTQELTKIGVMNEVQVDDHSYEAPVNPAGEEVRLDPAIEADIVRRMVAAGIQFEHFVEAD